MSDKPFLGVCYYPEHWSETVWADDAKKMSDLGIRQVRIGEFAWSRIEPDPGRFEWGWLDRAIQTLGEAGLEVMLGTPTATPPKWLIDKHPEILAYDEQGRPRQFGSRRHYCFSSDVYAAETARIVGVVAERYGTNPIVTAWQTDNEYGCHDTIRSYSPPAMVAFRRWLKERYQEISVLNDAWGCVFWSQEYRSFDEVDLPNLTVTEPNPSHVLDFYRFSSDQVVRYNRLQTEIIRRHSPGRDIVHNFMGFFFSFDHFAVAQDLDAVGWDSYPIGFLDVGPFPAEDKKQFMRQGHPDIAAFHHDLYRAIGGGRWRVLEQQPGPVNWAPHNPAPLPGMVHLWSMEAFAHGAESVNYFRWRQAPFAQEQMHAGLERPDGQPAPGYDEARRAGTDVDKLSIDASAEPARVAIVFSYDAHWLFEAHPQGAGWNYPEIVFTWYSALRRFGLNVDFIAPDMALDGYGLIIVPSLPVLSDAFVEAVLNSKAQIIFGARTGSKTNSLKIPDALEPDGLQKLLPLKVIRSESFPAFHQISITDSDAAGRAWLDHVDTDLTPEIDSEEGGLLFRHKNIHYLTTLPNAPLMAHVISMLAQRAGLDATLLPEELRLRRHGGLSFLFNYGSKESEIPIALRPGASDYVFGDGHLAPASVTVWRNSDASMGAEK